MRLLTLIVTPTARGKSPPRGLHGARRQELKCADQALARNAVLDDPIANLDDVPARYDDNNSKEWAGGIWNDDEIGLPDSD